MIYKEHQEQKVYMAVVLMVDAVCGAQHNGAAAILAAHGGRVDSFLLFLVFHGPFTSVRI